MAMRKTPYERLRYPWTSDVVSAADIDAMASDIDQALVQTASLAANYSRFSSAVVQRTTAQAITKATLTAISFNSVVLDNGSDSPLANGSWYNVANPTRLTAPTACVVVATAFGGMNFTSNALGVNGCVQVTVALNGATGGTGVQGTKWAPISTATGQTWASAISMWKLAAGDFLEFKIYWTGTPAGPFNIDTAFAPTFSLMQIALPTVP